MKRLAVALLFFAMPAAAGELGFYTCPTNDPDVTHFRVYLGTTLLGAAPIGSLESPPGVLGDCDGGGTADDQLVGASISGLPDNCASQAYIARFAVEDPPGVFTESGDSNAITSIARPTISAVTVGAAGIRQIIGENFVASTIVRKTDGTVIPSTFMSCQVLEITDTATRTIVVDTGLKTAQFTIPIEPPQGAVGF